MVPICCTLIVCCTAVYFWHTVGNHKAKEPKPPKPRFRIAELRDGNGKVWWEVQEIQYLPWRSYYDRYTRDPYGCDYELLKTAKLTGQEPFSYESRDDAKAILDKLNAAMVTLEKSKLVEVVSTEP